MSTANKWSAATARKMGVEMGKLYARGHDLAEELNKYAAKVRQMSNGAIGTLQNKCPFMSGFEEFLVSVGYPAGTRKQYRNRMRTAVLNGTPIDHNNGKAKGNTIMISVKKNATAGEVMKTLRNGFNKFKQAGEPVAYVGSCMIDFIDELESDNKDMVPAKRK